VQTTTNASAEYVEQWLQLRTSEFFTIDPGNVSVTARNARRESSGVYSSDVFEISDAESG